MKERTRTGGVCSVGRTPYFHSSASTSSRYRKVGRSAANSFPHGRERGVEAEHLLRLRERMDERRRFFDCPADDGFDDFRKLRRVCGGEENSGLVRSRTLTFAAVPADAEV